jgi:hypothetical protein
MTSLSDHPAGTIAVSEAFCDHAICKTTPAASPTDTKAITWYCAAQKSVRTARSPS